jgi:hypothetical protein
MPKLILIVCLLSCAAYAADKPGSKPLALPDFSQVSKGSDESGSFNVGFTCENDNGQKLKKDEVGFQECMESSQRRAQDRFKNQ